MLRELQRPSVILGLAKGSPWAKPNPRAVHFGQAPQNTCPGLPLWKKERKKRRALTCLFRQSLKNWSSFFLPPGSKLTKRKFITHLDTDMLQQDSQDREGSILQVFGKRAAQSRRTSRLRISIYCTHFATKESVRSRLLIQTSKWFSVPRGLI